MIKSIYSLIILLNLLSPPHASFSTELEAESRVPALKRTTSEEELFQLQEKKKELLQQRDLIRREARHREIEKLKREIQELEAENLLFQGTHDLSTSQEQELKENIERAISISEPALPASASLTSKQLAMGKLIERMCDHHQEALESISTSQRKGFHHEVFVYGLAKRCKASIQRVKQAIEVIKYEQNLVPSEELLKAFIASKLKQPFENDKVYQESIDLDAIPFLATFFVTNHNSQFTYDENQLRVVPLYLPTLEQTYRSLSGLPPLESLKSKLSGLLEGHAVDHVYPYKNKICFNYLFYLVGTHTQGRSRSSLPLIGVALFTKPIDAYRLME